MSKLSAQLSIFCLAATVFISNNIHFDQRFSKQILKIWMNSKEQNIVFLRNICTLVLDQNKIILEDRKVKFTTLL